MSSLTAKGIKTAKRDFNLEQRIFRIEKQYNSCEKVDIQ